MFVSNVKSSAKAKAPLHLPSICMPMSASSNLTSNWLIKRLNRIGDDEFPYLTPLFCPKSPMFSPLMITELWSASYILAVRASSSAYMPRFSRCSSSKSWLTPSKAFWKSTNTAIQGLKLFSWIFMINLRFITYNSQFRLLLNPYCASWSSGSAHGLIFMVSHLSSIAKSGCLKAISL